MAIRPLLFSFCFLQGSNAQNYQPWEYSWKTANWIADNTIYIIYLIEAIFKGYKNISFEKKLIEKSKILTI
jgi:hypothetical protein